MGSDKSEPHYVSLDLNIEFNGTFMDSQNPTSAIRDVSFCSENYNITHFTCRTKVTNEPIHYQMYNEFLIRNGFDEKDVDVRWHRSENDMLKAVAEYLSDIVITNHICGWNVENFDIPMLINRYKHNIRRSLKLDDDRICDTFKAFKKYYTCDSYVLNSVMDNFDMGFVFEEVRFNVMDVYVDSIIDSFLSQYINKHFVVPKYLEDFQIKEMLRTCSSKTQNWKHL